MYEHIPTISFYKIR